MRSNISKYPNLVQSMVYGKHIPETSSKLIKKETSNINGKADMQNQSKEIFFIFQLIRED
jgi:hypothetical protein